jgi:hypothetical protein
MKEMTDTYTLYPLIPSRAGACAQIEEELIERGHSIADGPSKTAIWCEPQPSHYNGFWVRGAPDLDVYIQPHNRVGGRPNKGQPFWMLEYPFFVCVKRDPTDPFRVNRIHEKTARVLRELGLTMVEEEDFLNTSEGASEHTSRWETRIDQVADAVDIIVALRHIESSQYPDGDEWMGGNYPAPVVQEEDAEFEEEPPIRIGCSRVVATGGWYWIPGVSEHSPIRLVGPCAELTATVYQGGEWVAHRLCGGVKAEGQADTIKAAMVAAKRAAKKGYGIPSKQRRKGKKS